MIDSNQLESLVMLMNYAQAFTMLVADLEKLRAQIILTAYDEKKTILPPDMPKMRVLREHLNKIHATCEQVPQLDRMRGPLGRLMVLVDNGTDAVSFTNSVDAMILQLLDELDRVKLFHVPEGMVQYYENPQPFGGAVFDAFPTAVLDSQNAGKCLALHQPTACMFHLMRVMECGLSTYAKKLGIAFAHSWESYINHLTKEFDMKWDRKSKTWKKNGPLHKEILGEINAIKIAWRNPTMHIVNDYSMEEAQRAYHVVLGFMQKLSKTTKERKTRANKKTG